MKKVIYFFVGTLLFTSCNITKTAYDDVYDQLEVNSTESVDDSQGYADYIKKNEKRYKIKPEQDFYSTGYANNQYNNNSNSSFNQLDDSEYYCYYHRRFHSHRFDTFYCSDWPVYGFNNPYYNNCNTYNGIYYGSSNYSLIGSYYGNYNGYYNNCGCFSTFNTQNFGYAYNYGIYPWTNPYNNNNPNYFGNSTSNENNVASTGSQNYYYGHRNGRAQGVNSGNTTVFPNTVKQKYTPNETPISKNDNIQNEQNYVFKGNPDFVKPYTPIQKNNPQSPQKNDPNSNQPAVANHNNNQKAEPIVKIKPAVNKFEVASKGGNSGSGNNGQNSNHYDPVNNKYGQYAGQNGSSSNSGSSSSSGSNSSSSRRYNSGSTYRGSGNNSNRGSSYTPRSGGSGSSSSGSNRGGSSSSSGSTGGSSRR